LAGGGAAECRGVFAERGSRHDRRGSEDVPAELVAGCWLPPEQGPDRDRWVKTHQKRAASEPKADYAHYWLGNAYYRAGRFAEAEASLRTAVGLSDALYVQPLLASALHQLGRTDEARRVLAAAEERYDRQVKEALEAPTHRLPQLWTLQPLYLITRREARTLLDGKDPGADPHEPALRARALERQAHLAGLEDDFARLAEVPPAHPRLWIDRGRRLGELGRWDEAAAAFAKAVELRPKDVQLVKERGRA